MRSPAPDERPPGLEGSAENQREDGERPRKRRAESQETCLTGWFFGQDASTDGGPEWRGPTMQPAHRSRAFGRARTEVERAVNRGQSDIFCGLSATVSRWFRDTFGTNLLRFATMGSRKANACTRGQGFDAHP